MAQLFRHPEILEIARQEGRVTVEDLAARFGVTVQTIRRDLADLAEAGRLARVHGGAVPSRTAVTCCSTEVLAAIRIAATASAVSTSMPSPPLLDEANVPPSSGTPFSAI